MILFRHEIWKAWVLLVCFTVGGFTQRASSPGEHLGMKVGAAVFLMLVPPFAMFLRLLYRRVRWSKEPSRPAWRQPWWKLRSNWMAAAAIAVSAVACRRFKPPLVVRYQGIPVTNPSTRGRLSRRVRPIEGYPPGAETRLGLAVEGRQSGKAKSQPS